MQNIDNQDIIKLKFELLYIIGMPAAGKSTLARQLSQKLQMPAYDLDVIITEQEGISISEIFAQKGENYFREIESQALRTTALLPTPTIVALGGGTPCFYDNMKWIKQQGTSLFLDLPFNKIAYRLQKDVINRPILSDLADSEWREKLMNIYNERLPFYEQADYRLEPLLQEA
ncbi:MAG: shikimate kinase [Bernardetiaceae bacterium]|nr:shikimate kinase [Bernardetiaceae bacterium]